MLVLCWYCTGVLLALHAYCVGVVLLRLYHEGVACISAGRDHDGLASPCVGVSGASDRVSDRAFRHPDVSARVRPHNLQLIWEASCP